MYTEELRVDAGFTWYELVTPVEIGRVEIRRGSTSFGCALCSGGGELDAVALVGYRRGGGPRVEMPSLIADES